MMAIVHLTTDKDSDTLTTLLDQSKLIFISMYFFVTNNWGAKFYYSFYFLKSQYFWGNAKFYFLKMTIFFIKFLERANTFYFKIFKMWSYIFRQNLGI
jgi:hypothetical protein